MSVTESQNPGMGWVQRGLKDHLISPLAMDRAFFNIPGCSKPGHGHFQEWGGQSFSEQPVQGLTTSPIFSYIYIYIYKGISGLQSPFCFPS